MVFKYVYLSLRAQIVNWLEAISNSGSLTNNLICDQAPGGSIARHLLMLQ